MYQYTYRTSSTELWQLSMYYIYGSLVGLCNVIFTAAVLALTYAKWSSAGIGFRCLLILGCCAFTVIQPLAVYGKAKKQAASITEDITISFDDGGIRVVSGGKETNVPWSRIKRVSKKSTMIVVFLDTTHGYVLSNRLLGKDRNAFYEYITARMEGKR